ncbi:hypothetical protein [Desulfoluna sp.]|uniref:hypothetical protein n=1 Tax=Desulfoluna sp. TaxID=2045199 RepID=UPI0026280917|nr:hypothetical protein [Desulfoluna sp.]
MKKTDKNKPAATNHLLFFLAGMVWISVGIMLLHLAFIWLSATDTKSALLFAGAGVIIALLAHHFGFLKIVDKNLQRIHLMTEKRCLFAFMSWKSYLIIPVMVTMGAVLRHSSFPKHYLAVIYIGVGLALILSSVRYVRTFVEKMM